MGSSFPGSAGTKGYLRVLAVRDKPGKPVWRPFGTCGTSGDGTFTDGFGAVGCWRGGGTCADGWDGLMAGNARAVSALVSSNLALSHDCCGTARVNAFNFSAPTDGGCCLGFGVAKVVCVGGRGFALGGGAYAKFTDVAPNLVGPGFWKLKGSPGYAVEA